MLSINISLQVGITINTNPSMSRVASDISIRSKTSACMKRDIILSELSLFPLLCKSLRMSETSATEKGLDLKAPGSPESGVTEEEEQKYKDEPRVSSILQELLDQHKAQSLVVQGLKDELEHLEQNPMQYFDTRKKFLYHAYTQTLKDCSTQANFDVRVCHPG